MKKLISIVLLVVLCLSVMAPGVSYAATVKLNKTNLELVVGDTYTLKLSGVTSTIKWSSSDSNVAAVNENGDVIAVTAGSAVISAKYSNKQYKCIVKVTEQTVALTVPAMPYDDDFATFLSEMIFQDELLNEKDNTVTYTMTLSQQKAILDYIRESFNQLMSSEELPDYYTDIKLSEDGTSIEAYVTKQEYFDQINDDYTILFFAVYSVYYQYYNGVSEDRMDLVINYYDNVTNEINDTIDSKDEVEGTDSRF